MYDDSNRTQFRDLPRSQQVWAVVFGLISLVFLVYAIADLTGLVSTKNPIIAAREAQDPILRWFWPLMSVMASFAFFALMRVFCIDTSDGRQEALRKFMRELRIIK
jgi:hypothetical protein